MRLKQLWSSESGHRGGGKWGLLAAVVVAAVIATVVFTGLKSSSAQPASQAKADTNTGQVQANADPSQAPSSQAESMTVLNPAPHQMAALNFLLGNYKCITAATPEQGSLTIHESTRKVLDGNYYQVLITVPVPGAGTVTAYWTLGWDSVDHHYIGQYFDNTGTFGTVTSAGLQNSHVVFSGQTIAVTTPGGVSGISEGLQITSRDDLSVTGSGRYSDTSSYLKAGKWVTDQQYSCQKA